MVSTKVILRKDKSNTKGEHPLYLRITQYRRSRYISLNIYLKSDQWDDKEKRVRKSYPNSQRLNNFIASKVADAQQVALSLDTGKTTIVAQQVKEAIIGKKSSSFIHYFERNLEELSSNGQLRTYNASKGVLNKIRKYVNGRDLTFEEITYHWLKNYEQYLRSKLGNKVNTIHANMKIIRKIINAAINEELVPLEKNPFRRFKLKWQNVSKDYLTEEELQALESLDLKKGSMKAIHRDMYVFAAYVGGLRISDILLLKWKDFDGERINIHTLKTGGLVTIKVPSRSLEIMQTYNINSQPSDYIFPVLGSKRIKTKREIYDAISAATAYVNKDLKAFKELLGLDKKLSFHTSRHTWATRALRKGMRVEYVSKLLGHNSIKTTQIYAKIVNSELDKAMEVFD